MKIHFFQLLLLTLISCTSDREYTYTLVQTMNNGVDTIVDRTKIIKASNDSTALVRAYRDFFFSQEFYYRQSFEYLINNVDIELNNPVHFILKNDLGLHVSDIPFTDKEPILGKLSLAANKRKELYYAALNQKAEQDSINAVTAKKMSGYFNHRKDEFRSDDFVWVEPKSMPSYINVNSIYCYFCIRNGKAQNFRLRIQYAAKEWLFIRGYTFNIDGAVFDYNPLGIERDHDSGIWEWSDNNLKSSHIILLEALAEGKDVKIQFIGRQYNKSRKITTAEITSIKRTYEYYKALGSDL